MSRSSCGPALQVGLSLLMSFFAAQSVQASHTASATLAWDASGNAFYTGTSNPSGPLRVNVYDGAPGYLNAVAGGGSGQTFGEVSITSFGVGQTELIALALHVTDSTGPSHPLSSLNDPALASIVSDLNATAGGSPIPMTAYAYNSTPSDFAPLQNLLTAGEAANGGQPFDILLVTNNPIVGGPWLQVVFNGELAQLNGITSIGVTDIGAIPEPSGLLCLLAPMLLLPRRRS
jgi:hypothetical protein